MQFLYKIFHIIIIALHLVNLRKKSSFFGDLNLSFQRNQNIFCKDSQKLKHTKFNFNQTLFQKKKCLKKINISRLASRFSFQSIS